MASVAATFMKKFFQRIIKDFQYKQLLPLKLLFFVHASTIFVLYPYLTIHMRELGINVEETAIMSAVTPVIAIIMPPLAGMVADKIGNFKILLSIFSALGGGAALLLLLVPVGRITITYPDRSILDVGCGRVGSDVLGSSQHPLSFRILENEPCDHEDTPLREIETRLESCGFACEPLHRTDFHEYERILTARSYHVAVTTTAENKTDTYYYKLTLDDMPVKKNDMRDFRNMENNIHYRTSIRNLTNSLFFFPTTGLYNMDCAENATNRGYQCDFGPNGNVKEGVSQFSLGKKMYTVNLMQLKDANGSSSKRAEFESSRIRQWFDAPERKKPSGKSQTQNVTCNNVYNELGQTILVRVPVHNPVNNEPEKTLLLGRCQPRCLLTVPRSNLCSNLKAEIVYDPKLTFWVYLIIRVFIGVIGGTAFAMFEGAVIAILREHNADYGLQRIYATIGGMISSPLSGLLIDYASQGKGYTDFRPAFYLYAFLKIASAFLMLTINLEFKAPATNVVHDVLAVLKNAEIVALFVAIFVLGTAWGYLESFLFWLLQDLGASRSLMGITITVGGIAGIPLLVLSGPIINRIGHANVLFIGFIFYAIRLTGYSLIYNPWLCLIFEAMESVTSSLSFTAAVTYAAKLSTTTTDTSIQGLLGGLYYGVGKGAGSLVGGYLMKGFGTRQTYRIFAVMCLIVGFIYFFFNKFFLRKRPMRQGNDIVKKKPKNTATNVVEVDVGSLNAMPIQEKPNGVPKSNDFKSEMLPINKTDLNKTYGNLGSEVKENGMPSDEGSKGDESQDRGKEEVNLGFVGDNEQDEKNSGDSGPKLQGAEVEEKAK